MVKLISVSFTVLVLTISAVKAQIPIVIANYPPINTVPDVKSAQVQAWLKELDLSGAPAIAPLTAPAGSPPACAANNACTWTCDNCPADDVTTCAVPNTWGLTFDDGPSTATPKLLDFLKTQKLAATFFLIGSNVIQHPDTVKRELAEGHHLASHTWSHSALTTLTNEQIVAEMKWTEKAVMDATGLRLKYMRPPYGDINNRVRFVLKKMGYIAVDWTGDEFDTNDWRIGTNNFTQAAAVSTFTKSLDAYVAGPNKATSGFYCLEHDVSDKTVTAALELVPLGVKRSINFASVSGCQSDAQPYQLGGTAPIPPADPVVGAGGTKPVGAGSSGSGTGNSPSGSNGPTVIKNSGASHLTAAGVFSAVAVAAAGALFA
ncbi:chitin deacetylase [Dissophora globulifera]|uniref:Chitin deacetylase n=1 Tax=Dissophora globulifera TaxID=979702 RepID=A0A9P6RC82_9FUNG|nr:chitin deacetylase [Dissophora globulifera]